MQQNGHPDSEWSPSTPALHEWQADHVGSVLPQLQQLCRHHKSPGSPPVMRVVQLDAGRLDVELADMLRGQLKQAFRFFRPGVLERLEPELQLLLDLMIFGCSVAIGRPTPGAALMNLRFRNERGLANSSQKRVSPTEPRADGQLASGRTGAEGAGLSRLQRTGYGLFILARYLWARGREALRPMLHHGPQDAHPGIWPVRLWNVMERLEATGKVASLLNLLLFLRHGVYRSVGERVVGARLVLQRPSMARALTFEILNRQLVWQELSELLLFLLPLVSATQLRSRLLRCLPRMTPSGAVAQLGGVDGTSDAQQQQCGICSSAMVQPYAAQPCGHRFCYFCLRSRTEADPQYKCPLCLQHVTAMRRTLQPLSGGASAAMLRS